MEERTYRIVKHIATLSGDGTKKPLELNRVAFYDNPARLDLRRWEIAPDGSKTPSRGVQISDTEFEMLKKIIGDL